MATCSSAPRSNSSMNGSPEICSLKRVQRAHSTQRSRSSSTWGLTATGLSYLRFWSTNVDVLRPCASAWSCSGHSPPLSHIGQSSGWLTSSSSSVPSWPRRASSLVRWVRTTMSGATGCVQLMTGLGEPSTSTTHCRQAPMGSSSGWSQKRGTIVPICSAARMMSVPLGTCTVTPSMVSVTRSLAPFCSLIRPPRRRRRRRRARRARPGSGRCPTRSRGPCAARHGRRCPRLVRRHDG